MKPEIRFPEFSGEWVKKRLGDVCKFFSGGTPSTTNKNFWNGNIPFIKSGEIHKETVSNYITHEGLNNSSAKMVNKGDLLLALYGATSGEVALSKINGVINQAILCIRCKGVYIPFLYYILNKNKNKIINKYTQGGQPNLSSKIIQSLYFLFPPTLAEQEKIASFLSAVDEKIELVIKKIEKLKQYKKALLQKMLQITQKGEPEFRFKEFSGKWVEKKLGDLIEEYTQKNKNEYEPVAVGVYGIRKRKEIFSKELTSNIKVNKVIFKNTLTFGIGTNQIVYGILLKDEYYSVSPAYKTFLIKNINSSFLNYLLLVRNKEMSAKYMIISARQGKSVNIKEILEYKLYIPPTLAEQEKIAFFLSNIDKKIELEENRLTKLKAYKKGLLQKMLI